MHLSQVVEDISSDAPFSLQSALRACGKKLEVPAEKPWPDSKGPAGTAPVAPTQELSSTSGNVETGGELVLDASSVMRTFILSWRREGSRVSSPT